MLRLLLLFLYVSISSLTAGPFWMGAGIGGASISGPSYSLSGTFQILEHPVTLRLGGANGDGEKVSDKTLLIGTRIVGEQPSFLSGGISFVSGKHGIAYNNPSNWIGKSYHWSEYKSIGFTGEFTTMKTYDSIGLGLTVGFLHSAEVSYGNITLMLNFGKFQ